MAEDNVSDTPEEDATAPDDTRPVLPADTAAQPASGPVLVPRLQDRVWSFRAMVAVALATLLIGGLAGGAIVAASDDDNDGHGRFLIGPRGQGDRLPPGLRHRQFRDGGPQWRWNDGPPPPGRNVTPYGAPSPPTPSP